MCSLGEHICAVEVLFFSPSPFFPLRCNSHAVELTLHNRIWVLLVTECTIAYVEHSPWFVLLWSLWTYTSRHVSTSRKCIQVWWKSSLKRVEHQIQSAFARLPTQVSFICLQHGTILFKLTSMVDDSINWCAQFYCYTHVCFVLATKHSIIRDCCVVKTVKFRTRTHVVVFHTFHKGVQPHNRYFRNYPTASPGDNR